MVRYLIKATSAGEGLIRGRHLIEGGAHFDLIVKCRAALILDQALIRGNTVKLRMLRIVSEKQNKLRKCCI